MRNFIFRDATNGDVKALAKLHVESWKVAYRPILTREHLDWANVQREVRRKRKLIKDGSPLVLAENEEEIVGFIAYSLADDQESSSPDSFEIDSFWVHHERTRNGIGSALLQEMIRRTSAGRISVWVLTGVSAGPSFYEKHDFRPDEHTRSDFVFLGVPMPMVRYSKSVRQTTKKSRKKK